MHNVTINDLQNEDWILRESGSGTGEYLRHFFRTNGLKIKSLLTISSSQGIKETVINNLGLSLLSKSVIERDLKMNAINVIPLQNYTFMRTFSYIYFPIMKEKGNVKIFIDALQNKG